MVGTDSNFYIDPDFYWNILVECLVQLHGKTHEEASQMVTDYEGRLRQAGNGALLWAYHEAPFTTAYDLVHPKEGGVASKQYLDFYERHKAEYERICNHYYE